MTFSLVGRCDRTGAVGAVIASASMAVAARCAAVRAGAGAVCSQSTTDPRLREALLEAMAGGAAAGDALAALTGPHRGHRVPAARGGGRGGRFGLLLRRAGAGRCGRRLRAGRRRRGQPARRPGGARGDARRLSAKRQAPASATGCIAALRAGLAAGGEVSPVRSAGMVIAESVPWPVTDLRVDWHDDPVGQLAGPLADLAAAGGVLRAARAAPGAGMNRVVGIVNVDTLFTSTYWYTGPAALLQAARN